MTDKWTRVESKQEQAIRAASRRGQLIPGKELVKDLAATKNLTTEAVVSVIEGQYQIAVERQHWQWIKDIRRQLGFLLDSTTIDRFFPLPWKDNRSSGRQKTDLRMDWSEMSAFKVRTCPLSGKKQWEKKKTFALMRYWIRGCLLRLFRGKSQGLGTAPEISRDLLSLKLLLDRKNSLKLLLGKGQGLGVVRESRGGLLSPTLFQGRKNRLKSLQGNSQGLGVIQDTRDIQGK